MKIDCAVRYIDIRARSPHMDPLRFNAVDNAETVCPEDAFLVEKHPEEGVIIRLEIACVVPPLIELNVPKFCEHLLNIGKVEKSRERIFFFTKHRRFLGFDEEIPRKALIVTYDLTEDGFITEKLGIQEIVVNRYSYANVAESEWFSQSLDAIKLFFEDNRRAGILFSTRWKQRNHGEKENESERALISALIDMFNQTVVEYAKRRNIPTLYWTPEGLLLRPPKVATIFSSPIRFATSFVNILNVVAQLENKPVPCGDEFLLSLNIPLHGKTA